MTLTRAGLPRSISSPLKCFLEPRLTKAGVDTVSDTFYECFASECRALAS